MQPAERLVLVGPAEPQLYGVSTPLYMALEWLATARNIAPVALYLQPDEDTEITDMAASLGILVFEQRALKTPEGRKRLQAQQPDWLLNLDGILLFPEEVLHIPLQGCINVHRGTLPEYGGRHAAQWAIRQGAQRFGACAHWLTSEVNAGDLIYNEEFAVGPDASAIEVVQRCSELCGRLATRVLDKIDRREPLPRTMQDASQRHLYGFEEMLEVGDASAAGAASMADAGLASVASGKIDWRWSAREVYDIVRGADYGPYPSPSYVPESTLDGEKILIRKALPLDADVEGATPGQVLFAGEDGVRVACGRGAVLLREVEPVAGARAAQRLAGAAIPAVLGIAEGDVLH